MGLIEDVEISHSIPKQKYFDSEKSVGKGIVVLNGLKLPHPLIRRCTTVHHLRDASTYSDSPMVKL